MAEIFLKKRYGSLVPASELDAEKIHAIQDGETFRCVFSKPRNVAFNNKYFALLDVLFECFEVTSQSGINGIVPTKNRDRFRKDIAIATGHYDLVVNIKQDVRAEARSISFAKMDELEFSQLFSKTIDYGLLHIAKNKSREDLESWVCQILDFDR